MPDCLDSVPATGCEVAGGISSQDAVRGYKAEMLTADTDITGRLHLIRAEYLESPGLHLTKLQVQRLWGLDDVTAEALLSALMDVKFLRRTHRNAYARADIG